MKKLFLVLSAFLAIPALAADTASGQAPAPAAAPAPPLQAEEPQHITVQHVLIGFKGSVPGKNITRSQDEAKTLAYDILARAKKGEEFDALVKQYTDDAPPGVYLMSNNGVPSSAAPKEFARGQMVPAFGNVGFKLKAGEIGIADYDPKTSPFGWHVIKRVK